MLRGYAAKVAGIPAFAKLNTGLKGRLAEIVTSISRPRVLTPGEILYEQGAEDESTGAVLVEGALTVTAEGGPSLTVSAPDLMGEMQQFDQYGQRTATVKAPGAATVLEFSWHEFVSRVRETPSIGKEDQSALKSALEAYATKRLHQL
jgi:CRP-like cAMP-binding protein